MFPIAYLFHNFLFSVLQVPAKRYDVYTLTPSGCACALKTTRPDCACCHHNGCQCGEEHLHCCVKCHQLGQCTNQPTNNYNKLCSRQVPNEVSLLGSLSEKNRITLSLSLPLSLSLSFLWPAMTNSWDPEYYPTFC